MAYVIYRTDTTEIVSEKDYSIQVNPQTQGHAKASLTRIKRSLHMVLQTKNLTALLNLKV